MRLILLDNSLERWTKFLFRSGKMEWLVWSSNSDWNERRSAWRLYNELSKFAYDIKIKAWTNSIPSVEYSRYSSNWDVQFFPNRYQSDESVLD